MGTARPLHKADELGRANERARRLLVKLREERALRMEAERNAKAFHAMMLKARIDLIRANYQDP